MSLSKEDFTVLIKNGGLIYFINDQICSPEPHYHLCLNISQNHVNFLCGTSRPESTTRFLELNKIDYSTFVSVKPSVLLNRLKLDTYFNCNQPYSFHIDDLLKKYNSNELRIKGEIAEYELLNIKNGIINSPLIPPADKDEFLSAFPDFKIEKSGSY